MVEGRDAQAQDIVNVVQVVEVFGDQAGQSVAAVVAIGNGRRVSGGREGVGDKRGGGWHDDREREHNIKGI